MEAAYFMVALEQKKTRCPKTPGQQQQSTFWHTPIARRIF